MRRPIVAAIAVAALALALSLAFPMSASATPTLASPGDGANVPAGSQVFTWTDSYTEGPIDHWYLEMSTNPETDYFNMGFFSYPPVYASGHLYTPSLNLNAIGRALPPGTYYWHVCGFYGAYGSLGTAWTRVRAFVVKASGAVAPVIAVTPTSLVFDIEQGDTNWHEQAAYISNPGGGTLNFQWVRPTLSPQWMQPADGDNTGFVYTLLVGVNASGLPVGSRSTAVTIRDNPANPSVPALQGGAKYVNVTVRVYSTDNAPPTGASIIINSAAASTINRDVTLNLSAADSGSGMGQMRFNDGSGWSEWVPYATTKKWLLTAGNGVKTIQAQFADKVGNVSGIVSDSITLATSASPVATSITIRTAATSTYIGRTVRLSGVVTPQSMIGVNIVVYVMKPGKTYWTYSSNRTAYTYAGSPASWVYPYYFKPGMARGYYKFKARCPAPGFESSAGYVVSESTIIQIRVR